MKPVKPIADVPGDDEGRIMGRAGNIIGYSKTRIVWRYGFLKDSPFAKATGVNVSGNRFRFVLAKPNGDILETFDGVAINMPKRFKAIIGKDL